MRHNRKSISVKAAFRTIGKARKARGHEDDPQLLAYFALELAHALAARHNQCVEISGNLAVPLNAIPVDRVIERIKSMSEGAITDVRFVYVEGEDGFGGKLERVVLTGTRKSSAIIRFGVA
jgi:hypothetical protein